MEHFFASIDWIYNVPAQKYCGWNIELQLHSQLRTTMAETNITDFNCGSSNKSFPNLGACNTYGEQDLKILLSRSSKGRHMLIIHLNTRSLSKNTPKIY